MSIDDREALLENLNMVSAAIGVAVVFLSNIARVSAAIQRQHIEGRGPTPAEMAVAAELSKQKRALAEAS